MKNPLKKIRISINAIFSVVLVLAVILFFVIRLNLVGRVTKNYVSSLLSEYMQTQVEIGEVDITGFNIATVGPLTLYDQQGDTLLYARRVMSSFEVWPLLFKELKLNTIQLIDFDVHATQNDVHAVPNYQFILDALTPKDKNSKKYFSAYGINAIFLRQGHIRFDVLNVKHNQPGQFDLHHVDIQNLSASMSFQFTPENGASFRIKRMEFDEQSGLNLTNARLRLSVGQEQLSLKNVDLTSGASQISIQEFNLATNPLSVIRQIGENQWLCDMKGFACCFAPEDLSHIEPRFCQLPHPLSINAEIHATSDTIILAPFHLTDKDSLALKCQMTVTCQDTSSTLKWIDQRQFAMDVNQMEVSNTLTSILCDFVPQLKDVGRRELSDAIGCFSFQGKTYGSRKQMNLDGHLLTAGKWQNAPLETDLTVQGSYDFRKNFQFAVNGTIPSVSYNGYSYSDVRLKATSKAQDHTLKLGLNDSHLKLYLNAKLHSGQDKKLQLEASVKDFQPYELKLSDLPVLDGLTLSLNTQANLTGSDLQNLKGTFSMDSIVLERGDSMMVALQPIRVGKTIDGNVNRGSFISDFLNLQYLSDNVERHRFVGTLSPTAEFLKVLNIDADFREPTTFDIVIDEKGHPQDILVDLKEILLPQGTLTAGLDVKKNDNDQLATILTADLISPKHRMNASISSSIAEDLHSAIVEKGIVSIDNIDFDLRDGYIAGNDSGKFVIEDLILQHDEQRLMANGVLGKGQKGLLFRLENFQIRPVLGLLGHTYIDFGGSATGDINMIIDKSKPIIRTRNLEVENFSYIGTEVGHANFIAQFDLGKNLLDIDARFVSQEQRHSRANGWIHLAKRDSMDLTFDLERLPIDFISYWVGNVLQDFKGYGSGEIHLYGACKHPNISGHPFADASFTHSFLGTRFGFKDIVHLIANEDEDSHIQLKEVSVNDGEGHFMRATADIRHDHLSRFRYNVDVQIPQTSRGFLVYNHPNQDNGAYYWGKLYATGQALLIGGDGVHNMYVNMQTADHSTFYLSPGEEHPAEENGKYQLLTYREVPSAAADSLTASNSNKEDDLPLNLNIELSITANEKCQVWVQLDPLSDDHLSCVGRGDLTIQYDPRSDMRIYGVYNMTSGSYTMTMSGDILTKDFTLLPTSSVRFSGPASQAELNWDCRYHISSVNLTDLDQSFATLASTSRSSVPVDCMMKVTGPMSQPLVSFDLEVKNVSDDVQALVHNMIGTPEMLNQEVFYLLLFSRFYTPSYAQAQQNHTGSELTSFASSSITSQLNNLLGRMSDNFTLGTNFRTERGDFTDMEMDLAISTRLFSNRLLINGNLGYRDPSTRLGLNNNTNSFIGDFDAEYLIKPSGTFRAKAYSHYNERDYSINNALTTQGIGLIWRNDFRTLKDLWRNAKR